MVSNQKSYFLATGEWMQYDALIDEICERKSYDKQDVKSKVDELVADRKVAMMHISNNKYINFDDAIKLF